MKRATHKQREKKDMKKTQALVAKKKAIAAVTRTTEGLRDALFEELDMLRNGDSTPQRAGAVSKLAMTVIDAARLDIEFVRFAKSAGKNKPQVLHLGRAA